MSNKTAAPPSRELIFQAALDEFSSNGLSGARVDEISAQAGLNKANLYRIFGSKKKLFEDCVYWAAGHLDIVSIEQVSDLENYAVGLARLSLKDDRFLRLFVWAAMEGLSLPGGDDWDKKISNIASELDITSDRAAMIIFQVTTNAVSTVLFPLPPPSSINGIETIVRGAVRGLIEAMVEDRDS